MAERASPTRPTLPALPISTGRATLPPYVTLPPVRPVIAPNPISPARPSINLGSPIRSSKIAAAAHLFDNVGLTNPIPFRAIPTPNPVGPTSVNYGSRVSGAIRALRASRTEPYGPGATPNYGQRVKAVIAALKLTRS